jgi:hypothetical protein
MGKTFTNDNHAKTSQNTKYGPKADDRITEEMRFMPFSVEIEHHKKRQKSKKDPFQHTRMFIQVIEYAQYHYLTTIKLIMLRKKSGKMPNNTEATAQKNSGITINIIRGEPSKKPENCLSPGFDFPKKDV